MTAPHDRRGDSVGELVRRRGSLLQTMKAVAWSFFGVRKRSDHEQDVATINPVHLVIAGLTAAMIFVGVLVVLVRWVIASGIAA